MDKVWPEPVLVELDDTNVLRVAVGMSMSYGRCPNDVPNDTVFWVGPFFLHYSGEVLESLDLGVCFL